MTEYMQGALYLDDIAPGQRFISASHRIDAEQIKTFAREFDPQPFHLDEGAAQATIFGGLAASGWHVAAITMKLLVGEAAPFAGELSAPVARSHGQSRPAQVTFSMSKAKLSR